MSPDILRSYIFTILNKRILILLCLSCIRGDVDAYQDGYMVHQNQSVIFASNMDYSLRYNLSNHIYSQPRNDATYIHPGQNKNVYSTSRKIFLDKLFDKDVLVFMWEAENHTLRSSIFNYIVKVVNAITTEPAWQGYLYSPSRTELRKVTKLCYSLEIKEVKFRHLGYYLLGMQVVFLTNVYIHSCEKPMKISHFEIINRETEIFGCDFILNTCFYSSTLTVTLPTDTLVLHTITSQYINVYIWYIEGRISNTNGVLDKINTLIIGRLLIKDVNAHLFAIDTPIKISLQFPIFLELKEIPKLSKLKYIRISMMKENETVSLPSSKYSINLQLIPSDQFPLIGILHTSLHVSLLNVGDFGNYTFDLFCGLNNKSNIVNACPQTKIVVINPVEWKEQTAKLLLQRTYIQEYMQTQGKKCQEAINFQCSQRFCFQDLLDQCYSKRLKQSIFYLLIGLSTLCANVVGCCCNYWHRKRNNSFQKKLMGQLETIIGAETERTELDMTYDVFISHSSRNSSWVNDELLFFLEKKGYKVCFGERDFLPGSSVIGSIVQAIKTSHKTIAVLSPDFLKSKWCVDLELIFCVTRILNKEGPTNSLIIMQYESCKIPDILTKKIFLDYSLVSGRKYFWEKLQKALGPPVTGMIQSNDISNALPDNIEQKT